MNVIDSKHKYLLNKYKLIMEPSESFKKKDATSN